MQLNRRSFLTATGAASLAALAGCLGGGGSSSGAETAQVSEDEEMNSIGSSVTYGGLKFTVADPVLIDHYGPYDCSGGEFWEDNEATQCTPPEAEDFQDAPTQGGQFLALQLTVEHVGERRITLPNSEENFSLINDGYVEDEFLIESPWIAASYVFPSYWFFVQEYEMASQGVFPGVATRGYIAFEVPIEANPEDFTAELSWQGNADESQTAYWNLTSDDVTDYTESEPPEIGGQVFFEKRGGGVQWGGDNYPEPPEDYENSGIRWSFNGNGTANVQDDSDNSTATGSG